LSSGFAGTSDGPDPDDEAPGDTIGAYKAVGRKLRDRAFGDREMRR
jgi:hypothetical protein